MDVCVCPVLKDFSSGLGTGQGELIADENDVFVECFQKLSIHCERKH